MSTSNSSDRPSSPVHYRLYQRFYKDDNALMDRSASNHWRSCARQFQIKAIGQNEFELFGYGFGVSDKANIVNRFFGWMGNQIHSILLKSPTLNEDIQIARVVVKRLGLWFSQDAFRQVCTLNLLSKYLADDNRPERILVIGDGHGILSALLHTKYPNTKIYLVDLGSVLFFQAYNHNRAFPGEKQCLTDESEGTENSETFSYCPADSLNTLPNVDFDLAINVASMQEMDSNVVDAYFSLLRQHNTRLFYCCNRLEIDLGGGEISRFLDYPWLPDDEHLIDEPCPWHQWFFGKSKSPNAFFTVFQSLLCTYMMGSIIIG